MPEQGHAWEDIIVVVLPINEYTRKEIGTMNYADVGIHDMVYGFRQKLSDALLASLTHALNLIM